MIRNRLAHWSESVASFERLACSVLLVVLVALIFLNVTSRAFDVALYWVDELAVYTMIWMGFIGGSLLLHERRHVAVTILIAKLSENRRRILFLLADLFVLVFAAGLIVMSVVWYDPIGVARYGWIIDEYAANTFNFIYQEPTNTLGIKKFWVWIVVPIVSITMFLHALSNLLQDASGSESR